MSDIAERYARVTTRFTDRVRAVPAGAWDNPSPCEGWTARDVVDAPGLARGRTQKEAR